MKFSVWSNNEESKFKFKIDFIWSLAKRTTFWKNKWKVNFFLTLNWESFVFLLSFKVNQESRGSKREATLLCHGDFTPKKWHTYEKCFVHPVVDSKVNPNFKEQNAFTWRLSLQNTIHLKWLRKLYSFLGSLMSAYESISKEIKSILVIF